MSYNNYREFLGLPKLHFKKPKTKRVYKNNLIQHISGDDGFRFPFLPFFFGQASEKIPATPGSSVPPAPSDPSGYDYNSFDKGHKPEQGPDIRNRIEEFLAQTHKINDEGTQDFYKLKTPGKATLSQTPSLNRATTTSIEIGPADEILQPITNRPPPPDGASSSRVTTDLDAVKVNEPPHVSKHVTPMKPSDYQLSFVQDLSDDDYEESKPMPDYNVMDTPYETTTNITSSLPKNQLGLTPVEDFPLLQLGSSQINAEQNETTTNFHQEFIRNILTPQTITETPFLSASNNTPSIYGSSIIGDNITIPLEDATATTFTLNPPNRYALSSTQQRPNYNFEYVNQNEGLRQFAAPQSSIYDEPLEFVNRLQTGVSRADRSTENQISLNRLDNIREGPEILQRGQIPAHRNDFTWDAEMDPHYQQALANEIAAQQGRAQQDLPPLQDEAVALPQPLTEENRGINLSGFPFLSSLFK